MSKITLFSNTFNGEIPVPNGKKLKQEIGDSLESVFNRKTKPWETVKAHVSIALEIEQECIEE